MTFSKAQFFELSLEMLCVASFEGYFLELNPIWSRVLGWSDDELKARPFLDFVHTDDQASTRAAAARLGEEGADVVNFENRYRCRDGGHRWLRWNATVDPDAGCILAVAHDVTDLHEALAQLRFATEAAERANLAKSAFLANMSHELRTPLNSIIGFTQVLTKNREGNLSDRQLDYLQRVLRNGSHLLALINDILDVSKIESGKLEVVREPVSVEAVLRRVAASLEPQAASARVTLLVEALRGSDIVVADGKRLEQVVLNLAANAIKFTPPGGRVLLRRVDGSDGRPHRIDVVDTGRGVPPDALGRVFEAFEQVDRSDSREHGGTGLGLTISRALARLMGFDMDVVSVEGRGSTFAVRLRSDSPTPVHGAIEAGGGALDGCTPVRLTRPATVYLVGPDPSLEVLVGPRIRASGHLTRTVSSVDELVRLRAKSPTALVILDGSVPPSIEPFQSPDAAWLEGAPIMACADRRGPRETIMVQVLAGGTDLDERLRALVERQKHVLIVDDDDDVRSLLADVVEEMGARVELADDGARALSMMLEAPPDLVLLDLMMPVMDGFELLRRMRADPRLDGVPVVVLTAMDLSLAEAAHLGRHGASVLTKAAMAGDQLRGVIEDALES